MKLAVPMCDAPPPWLGPSTALPVTVPSSSTVTKVRSGGVFIQISRACASVVSRSHENVSPAAMILRWNAQIAGHPGNRHGVGPVGVDLELEQHIGGDAERVGQLATRLQRVLEATDLAELEAAGERLGGELRDGAA